jgi:hypothetical protein
MRRTSAQKGLQRLIIVIQNSRGISTNKHEAGMQTFFGKSDTKFAFSSVDKTPGQNEVKYMYHRIGKLSRTPAH